MDVPGGADHEGVVGVVWHGFAEIPQHCVYKAVNSRWLRAAATNDHLTSEQTKPVPEMEQRRSRDRRSSTKLRLPPILRDEFLNGEIFYTLREAKVLIEAWRWRYNTIRPPFWLVVTDPDAPPFA
jgi:hypothetical protein